MSDFHSSTCFLCVSGVGWTLLRGVMCYTRDERERWRVGCGDLISDQGEVGSRAARGSAETNAKRWGLRKTFLVCHLQELNKMASTTGTSVRLVECVAVTGVGGGE